MVYLIEVLQDQFLGRGLCCRKMWLFLKTYPLKDRKQLIKVVEKEGLGLIWFFLVEVNVGQND